jgi:hypothetical protein
MSGSAGNAPAWLFSFVDLAFLVLISLTQIGVDDGAAPDLGGLAVPRIAHGAVADLTDRAAERWQLRVHPPGDAEPFELVEGGAPAEARARLDEAELAARLAALRRDSVPRPLLAPDEDSRSRHLLAAASLLEQQWPGRRALVDRSALPR